MSWKRISVDRADEIAAAMRREQAAANREVFGYDPATEGDPKCPDCKGRGEVATSTLDPSIGVWMPDAKKCPTCRPESDDVIPYEP